MTDVAAPENGTVQIVREAILRGKSFADVQRLYGIPAHVAEKLLNDYYSEKHKTQDQNVQRMVQMERLEMMIEPLMDQALLGNVKASEVMVKHLQSLSELLGLNLQQEKIQVEIITDQQGQVIFEMMSYMQAKLLTWVQVNLANSDMPQAETTLALIEDKWDDMVAEAITEARQRQQTAVIEAGAVK